MANWANVDYDDVDDASVSNNALYLGNAITFTKRFHNCLILAFFLMKCEQHKKWNESSVDMNF